DIPANKEGYYGLRYAQFVVPLVKAVQEQQKQIEEQEQQIQKLEDLVLKLSDPQNHTNSIPVTLTGAYLEQNFPNPHNGATTIRYHLPQATQNARVIVTNMKGQVMKTID